MITVVRLGAYGLGAIGLVLVIGGLYFLKKGNDQLGLLIPNSTQIASASATTSMGWNLIYLGIFVAVLGVLLGIVKQKGRRGGFHR